DQSKTRHAPEASPPRRRLNPVKWVIEKLVALRPYQIVAYNRRYENLYTIGDLAHMRWGDCRPGGALGPAARLPPAAPMDLSTLLEPPDDSVLSQAAEMRANGYSWKATARDLGRQPDELKRQAKAACRLWRRLLSAARREV